jgi:predicted acetyltransferase
MHIRTTDQRRGHTRELLIADQPVSSLEIIDYDMRIGSTQVRMAGIGGVHTRREHRMKGYMRALIEDSLAYMAEHGYEVSMLFGISDFYVKFGYASCLPEHKTVIQTRDAEEAQAEARPIRQRKLRAEDMEAVLELYNRNNCDRTCSIVRDPRDFLSFPKGSRYGREADAMVLYSEDRVVRAYAVLDHSREAVNVVEAEAQDECLFPSLLYQFARVAIKRRCGYITLFLPPDHPFARHVQNYGCEQSTQYRKNGGGMMRIIDQQALFQKIAPMLEQRAALRGPTFAAAVTIQTNLGTTGIRAARGKLLVNAGEEGEPSVSLSQDRLTQLVVGYRTAQDVLNDPHVESRGEVGPVLDVLFPRGYPYVWLADLF